MPQIADARVGIGRCHQLNGTECLPLGLRNVVQRTIAQRTIRISSFGRNWHMAAHFRAAEIPSAAEGLADASEHRKRSASSDVFCWWRYSAAIRETVGPLTCCATPAGFCNAPRCCPYDRAFPARGDVLLCPWPDESDTRDLALTTLTFAPILSPTPAQAGTYYGVRFYGTYATHRHGAGRFYKVRERFRF
jgi:hypothetical protein